MHDSISVGFSSCCAHGRQQRCRVLGLSVFLILDVVFSLLVPSHSVAEGFALLLNRTLRPIPVEIILVGQDDLGGQQQSAPPILAPLSMMIVRCENGLTIRAHRGASEVVDVPLLPGTIAIAQPVTDNGQAAIHFSTCNLAEPEDLCDRLFFSQREDGLRTGYQCTRWSPGEKSHRIRVKILVDDEEAATPAIWKARLARRIGHVNEILLAFCEAYLEITSFDTWESDDNLIGFEDGFREFVSHVDPAPAVLAIGFSAQWAISSTESTLGVSAGPLTRHILIREYGSGITESERVEMLLHELGHYLGATHVTDDNSVMRYRLEKRPARDRLFSIGFDSINTLIINTVVDELRMGQTHFAAFSPKASEVLRACYRFVEAKQSENEMASRLAELLPALPDNSSRSGLDQAHTEDDQTGRANSQTRQPSPTESVAAAQPATPTLPPPDTKGDQQTRVVPDQKPEPSSSLLPSPRAVDREARTAIPSHQSPVSKPRKSPENYNVTAGDAIEGARVIVHSVVGNWTPPKPEVIPRGHPPGDCILEELVRRSAAVACQLRIEGETERRGAFLLAIGVLSDDSNLLRDQPGLGDVLRQIEPTEQRKLRLSKLGIATIFGRHDWAQHFCVSAALVHVLGAGPSRSLGLAKEWRDSQGDSGWSFADLAADFAGIRFAESVLSGEKTLEEISADFQIAGFVPSLREYEENIPFTSFVGSYGGLFGQRTQSILRNIEQAIQKLPAYQSPVRDAKQ